MNRLVKGVPTMGDSKKIDKREGLRIITSNAVVSAEDLSELSLNARKLFYIAVSQCKKDDSEFYEFETTPAELAEIWDVSTSNIYHIIDKTTTELMKIVITLRNETSFQKRHLFEKCSYESDKILRFRLHPDMADLLLGLKKDFSKPLVWDFMKMKSPYSMAIWHLMQREMKSFKPMLDRPIEFDLTLKELREVTGTENKFQKMGQFKQNVLDKAIAEIKKNCLVLIRYDNIRPGKCITGFRFTAESYWGTMDISKMSYRDRLYARKALLVRKRADGIITPEEKDELLDITLELEQVTLEDVEKGYNVE